VSLDASSLRKVLQLEAEKGCHDTAVIGGLDRLLISCFAGSSDFTVRLEQEKNLRQHFRLQPGYSSLGLAQRAEWINKALSLLEKTDIVQPVVNKKTGLTARRKEKPALAGHQDSQNGVSVKRVKISRIDPPDLSLEADIVNIKGISPNIAARFHKLGVRNIRDLLYFFPRRHLDYSDRKTISTLSVGKEETIVASVWQAKVVNMGRRRNTEAIVGDETGNVRVIWFNNPYVARNLKTNDRIIISGRVSLYHGQYVFQSPEWEPEESETIHTGRLVPLYHLTQGLRPRQVRKLMKSVIDRQAGHIPDFLPGEIITRQHLLDLNQAISQAHFPDEAALKDRARVRLAFDELFLLQLGVLSKKRSWQEGQPGNAIVLGQTARDILNRFIKALPFKLTSAQDKALKEILSDMAKPRPMSRLLQGDVGSGKTIVAAASLLAAVANGFQGAFMAPTEILAEQHFATISQLLSRSGQQLNEENNLRTYDGLMPRPVTVALLTGDLDAGTRKSLHKKILEGDIDIVVGTHAIIQKDVEFHRLGAAIVDEQHRFGVTQRLALRQKGANPHILVMTATPIPRTLALTIYGDLDLSVIDQLPAGRQVIKTKWLKPEQRPNAYNFIHREVAKGRQAFIICPLVEESEAVQARAAVAEYEHLSGEVFLDLKLGLVHGRMAAGDKDNVMRQFRTGELNILVATPVIEVGIDVPNATVMMIESADRFGLSQLHQFRGRVGRGPEQSYCMLLAEDPSEIGRQRLDIIERVYDGFKLAEEDLQLRGPGEFFGTRQSGLPDLRMARLSDVAILEAARNEATILFEDDPRLKKPEHFPLAGELSRIWPESAEWS
jgi:ATP-dependent DNA helicase RecG